MPSGDPTQTVNVERDHPGAGFIFKLNEVKETRLKYFPTVEVATFENALVIVHEGRVPLTSTAIVK